MNVGFCNPVASGGPDLLAYSMYHAPLEELLYLRTPKCKYHSWVASKTLANPQFKKSMVAGETAIHCGWRDSRLGQCIFLFFHTKTTCYEDLLLTFDVYLISQSHSTNAGNSTLVY